MIDTFSKVKELVAKNHAEMMKEKVLFQVSSDRDEIVDCYLNGFPEEERQEHNCNCCKSFIRQVGGMVSLSGNGRIRRTVWCGIPAEGRYGVAVAVLRDYVLSRPIRGLYGCEDEQVSRDQNFSEKHQCMFSHFAAKIPKQLLFSLGGIDKRNGVATSTRDVLARGVEELTEDAFQTVRELIDQNSLYRGKEYLHIVDGLKSLKSILMDTPEAFRKDVEWFLATNEPETITRGRNTAIGTLLVDLSEGVELEKAVKSFEQKVAPNNYKRPTALVTPRMVDQAKEKLGELGLISALERRRLDTRDLTPENALYVHKPRKQQDDVFALIKGEEKVEVDKLSKVETITIQEFVDKVLPNAKSIRALVENTHIPSFVTMTGAVDPEAPSLMKWDNSFGWSYSGGVADSLRDRVQELGGRVDGVLRFSHTWNYNDAKPNQSLMDLHVFIGCGDTHKDGCHNTYPTGDRVGWNRRSNPKTKGVQDVDFVNPPLKEVPVENITFPRMDLLPETEYIFKIHNWSLRQPTQSGFRAEIEANGQIYQYELERPMRHHEWVTVATATLKDGVFDFSHKLPTSASQRQKWGVTTNSWTNVKAITLSPNHWTKPTGNKHWFFILEGCVSDEKTRPFYNEFLCNELSSERKVCEILANKIEVLGAEGAELSGIGFSETQRNHIHLEVEGAFKRVVKVTF